MTSVHIGNYGTKSNENQSNKVQIAGLVVETFLRLIVGFKPQIPSKII